VLRSGRFWFAFVFATVLLLPGLYLIARTVYRLLTYQRAEGVAGFEARGRRGFNGERQPRFRAVLVARADQLDDRRQHRAVSLVDHLNFTVLGELGSHGLRDGRRGPCGHRGTTMAVAQYSHARVFSTKLGDVGLDARAQVYLKGGEVPRGEHLV
jgi:hypothetical protein